MNYIKKFSILLPITILLILSLFNMYGASFTSNIYRNSLLKQSMWIVLGTIIMFAIYKIDMNFLLKTSTFFYILGILSLILVLFLGVNINGATSWYRVGPFTMQPSEIFKFFYIIYISKVASKDKHDFLSLLDILILTFIPCILIFMEPDTGVVLLYLLIMLGVLLESKIKKRYLIGLIAFAAILLGIFFYLYFCQSELFISLFGTSFFYRMDRLLDTGNTSSYQLKNALTGIGASGLFGLGLKSEKIYIPEATTDFVFDLSICNFGYLVGIIIVFLYAFILYKIYNEMYKSKNMTNRLILSGIFYMMFFQIAEHILMNLGLTPITGITLPFLSYGGSSLLSYFLLMGLVLKIIEINQSDI